MEIKTPEVPIENPNPNPDKKNQKEAKSIENNQKTDEKKNNEKKNDQKNTENEKKSLKIEKTSLKIEKTFEKIEKTSEKVEKTSEEVKILEKEDPLKNLMQYGDHIILYLNRNKFYLQHLTPGSFYDTDFGRFKHEYFINRKYGSKIFSLRERGFAYAFKFEPSFFTRTLLHKTQILYFHDISLTIFNLEIERGSIVYESGTGSGSMSYSLGRAVGREGRLFSFEFNRERAENVREVFGGLGVENVLVVHRDVLKNGFKVFEQDLEMGKCKKKEDAVKENDLKNDKQEDNKDEIEADYIKKLNDPEIPTIQKADAIFLDLPQPSLVINSVKQILKLNGRLCSFSPCIEQISRTAKTLANFGFSNIKMVECIEREFWKRNIDNRNCFSNQIEKKDFGFFVGEKVDKGHTGYLLFATNRFN